MPRVARRRRFKQVPLFPEPLRPAIKRSGGPVHIVDPASNARTVCGQAIPYGTAWLSHPDLTGKPCRKCERMRASAEELCARLYPPKKKGVSDESKSLDERNPGDGVRAGGKRSAARRRAAKLVDETSPA